MKTPGKLVLYSQYAFYPMHFEAFRYLFNKYKNSGMEFHIIIGVNPKIPSVHRQLGWVTEEQALEECPGIFIHKLPGGLKWFSGLKRLIHKIKPDYLWIQEEPNNKQAMYLLQLMRAFPEACVALAACENIYTGLRWNLLKLWGRFVWPRTNMLLATAVSSIEGLKKGGFPANIPYLSLVAGCQAPPESIAEWAHPGIGADNFVVGFVGCICEEKGWKVLLEAFKALPSHCRCLMVGDGPQIPELQEWLKDPALADRVFFLGLMPKEKLWSVMKKFNCLVLPSLTAKRWKEQFGGVMADAMALGMPVIGSDSGSIPEVIGPAGISCPEGEYRPLREALLKVVENPELCREFTLKAVQRYKDEFSIEAYGRKIAQGLGL